MRSMSAALLASFALAACGDAQLDSTSAELSIPSEIAVPPGQHITIEADGFGFQIYECRADADGNKSWAFRAPAAVLLDEEGKLVITHFGGVDVGLPAGVYWQSALDGSRVHGGNAITAPNLPNIPLVRLSSLDNAGVGIFAPTTFIQRLETFGGAAPPGSCGRIGSRLPVYYQAHYVFYAAAQPRPEVPEAIAVADGNDAAFTLSAEGVQIYDCKDGAWTFHAPRADLYDADGNLIIHHFGGIDAGLPAGVYWQSTRDGSRVLAGKAVASPNPGAIALLRLEALDHAGTGIVSRVSFIQRLDTVGGLAPAGACEPLDSQVEVPYSANYTFFIPSAN